MNHYFTDFFSKSDREVEMDLIVYNVHEVPLVPDAIKISAGHALMDVLPFETPMNLTMSEYTIAHVKFMRVLKDKIAELWRSVGKYWQWCHVHHDLVPSLLKFIHRLTNLLYYQKATFIPAMTSASTNTMWYEKGSKLTRNHRITVMWTKNLTKPLMESPTTISCYI